MASHTPHMKRSGRLEKCTESECAPRWVSTGNSASGRERRGDRTACPTGSAYQHWLQSPLHAHRISRRPERAFFLWSCQHPDTPREYYAGSNMAPYPLNASFNVGFGEVQGSVAACIQVACDNPLRFGQVRSASASEERLAILYEAHRGNDFHS